MLTAQLLARQTAMPKRLRACSASLLLCAASLSAQQTPAFEVASIKPHAANEGSFSFEIEDSGRLTVRNMTVWNLARQAYGWRDSQIAGGPSWLRTEGFDIIAQPGLIAPVPRSRVLEMLQSLLKERFQFQWHEEVRATAAYALRVAPGGPKLAPARDGVPKMQIGNLSAARITMESLCQIFEFELAKPVVDQTGLSGSFAIELQWAREKASLGPEPDLSLPSLFTAVRERLGLRLEPEKLPVKMFVIDEVQRPTSN